MDQPTCGEGLAEHSTLPARLADWAASMADNLEAHTKSLNVREENGRKEYGAYLKLVMQYRQLAKQLQTVAAQMAAYRELPMAGHDPAVLSSSKTREPFERLVTLEQELLELLQKRVEEHRRLLAEMTSAGA